MSKKFLSSILTAVMCLSLCTSAFASEEPSAGVAAYDPTLTAVVQGDDNDIMPLVSTNLAFSNLAKGKQKNSSDSYYMVNGKDVLYINSLTWSSSGQDIRVGFHNVQTGINYGYTFSGGTITDFTLNMGDAPDGEYEIYVLNNGSGNQSVTGNLSYDVQRK